MAMGVSSGGSLQADINVTPMIDVLLVLLIIFMITLPLGRRAIDVQVPPEQQQKNQKQQASDQIVLELTADGGYSVNTKPVPLTGLAYFLKNIFDARAAKLMFIKAAPNREYGDVIAAMDIAKSAGVQVIGFTPPPDQGAAK